MEIKRFEVINPIIEKIGAKSYLEIGVQEGICFNEVVCEKKVGVDPAPRWSDERVHLVTSDVFFETNTEKFDVIFIDGLHEHEQVSTDIVNSLKALNKDGVILVHDCNPIDKEHQVVPLSKSKSVTWNGDVWKGWVRAVQLFDFESFTVNIDHGVGVMNTSQSNSQPPQKSIKYSYEEFDIHRNEWIHLIDFDNFMVWCNVKQDR